MIKALTDNKIKNLKYNEVSRAKNWYADGNTAGLYIVIGKKKKLFKFRYKPLFSKNRTTITIGEYPYTNLSSARKKVFEFKVMLEQGIEPQEHKQQQKAQLIQKRALKKKISAVIEEYLQTQKSKVSETRYKKNYLGTIGNYILPFIL